MSYHQFELMLLSCLLKKHISRMYNGRFVHNFKLVGLDQIRCQKNNQIFVKLLNKVRVGETDQDDEDILKSQTTHSTQLIHCIFLRKMLLH